MQWLKSLCVLMCLLAILSTAQASVIVGGTRVIYDGTKREASLAIKNPEKTPPSLIQSWVENSTTSNSSKVPFIITPPLFRLDAAQENILRIVHTGESLPEDRESVFWLNIKSIPSSTQTDQNQLQIAVKTRIKLFYRPIGLEGNAGDAYKALIFHRHKNQLLANNPTQYHVSFQRLSVGDEEIEEAGMIAPMGTLQWELPANADDKVSWQAINDFGGITEEVSTTL